MTAVSGYARVRGPGLTPAATASVCAPRFDTRRVDETQDRLPHWRTTRESGHVDKAATTLWYVLRGSEDLPASGDPGEFHGVRWVGIDDLDDWVGTCYTPAQVRRFPTKLKQTLDPPAALRW